MEELVRKQLKLSKYFRDTFYNDWFRAEEGTKEAESLYRCYREADTEVRILEKILRKYEAEK